MSTKSPRAVESPTARRSLRRMVGAVWTWLRTLVAIYALLFAYAVLAPFRTYRVERGLLEGMNNTE